MRSIRKQCKVCVSNFGRQHPTSCFVTREALTVGLVYFPFAGTCFIITESFSSGLVSIKVVNFCVCDKFDFMISSLPSVPMLSVWACLISTPSSSWLAISTLSPNLLVGDKLCAVGPKRTLPFLITLRSCITLLMYFTWAGSRYLGSLLGDAALCDIESLLSSFDARKPANDLRSSSDCEPWSNPGSLLIVSGDFCRFWDALPMIGIFLSHLPVLSS